MCFDARGDMFTADCHSKPITMILRGSYHDSFGKPHDGLGFAPIVTSNDHGSTGIGGITAYEADHFPPEYRGNLFVCNVVTNRVHRDVIEWRGSSPWIQKPEDFLVCDDSVAPPGRHPDGPGRGVVHRGLLQQHHRSLRSRPEAPPPRPSPRPHLVVYTGKDNNQAAPTPPNLMAAGEDELVKYLSNKNLKSAESRTAGIG